MEMPQMNEQELEDFLAGYLVAWKESDEGIIRTSNDAEMTIHQDLGYQYFWRGKQ